MKHQEEINFLSHIKNEINSSPKRDELKPLMSDYNLILTPYLTMDTQGRVTGTSLTVVLPGIFSDVYIDTAIPYVKKKPGTLDLIMGPMYSGKSTELLRRLFTVSEAGVETLYINHSSDTRNVHDVFSTHNPLYQKELKEHQVKMISVSKLKDAVSDITDTIGVIGIDESQFFEDLEIVLEWVEKMGKKVIVAGLDGNSKRQKFGKIIDLIPLCDTVEKLHPYCQLCKGKLTKALFTHYYLGTQNSVIDIGAKDKYIPLCREHYMEKNI